MKKFLFLWLLLVGIRGIAAQNIVEAEYFIDKDPGLGNATSISVGASADVTLNFSADVSGLSNGFHTLYFRSKDENDNWSALNTWTFFTSYVNTTPSSVNIEQMEYFIDKDPGFGNATPVPGGIITGSTVTKSFSIDMTTLNGGFHTLYVRSRDANGMWNVAPASVFYRVPDAIVDPLADIVKMEYFIDKDPGFGSATDVAVVAGSNLTKSFSIDMTNVSGGFHTLFVRTQDADGFWNVAPASVFYRVPDAIVDPLANIVKMEYFIDKDPGFGSATDVAVVAGSNVTKSFSIDLTNVSGGFHTLYVRTQDADGLWNVAPASAFYRVPDAIVDPLANIVKMEYFIDKDPGFGLGNDIAFTPGSDVSKNFAIDLTSVPAGFHTLYIRAKDADGLWNAVQADPFYRAPGTLPSSPSPIIAIEYYFKKNGFTSSVNVFNQFTPSSDVQLTFNPVFTGLQADSVYNLRVYAKDSTGKRSLEYDSSITIAEAWLVNPNHSPAVTYRIDDQNIAEDFGSAVIADLDTVFSDSDIATGDSLRYNVSLTNAIVTTSFANNTLQINSIANLNGTTSVILTATDDSGAVARDTFTVTISAVNDIPVAANDVSTSTAGQAKIISVLNNDTDVDGDVLTITSVVSAPLHGTAVKNAGDTTITYTATITYSGSDQFTYAMSDGHGGLDTATVTVSVAPGGTLAISTSVLQNPALSKYADFYVIADTTLTGVPAVKLFVGTDSTSIAMSATSNVRIYKGSITFTQSGNYSIRTQATAVNGAGSVDNHPFNVTVSKPGLSATLSSVNGKALLKLSAKAIKEETYFTAFDESRSPSEMIYEFGPKLTLNDAVELTIAYDPQDFPDAGKLFIYHKEGDNWIRLRSQVYINEQIVKTRISVLGLFKLGYDPSYEGTNVVPTVFALKQNYPNPFNPSTTITYDVPEDTKLNLTIYNLLGQKVKTLYSGNQLAGTYHTIWNGTNERGQSVASGIYFYRLETKSFVKTQKMLLIK